MPPTNAPQNQMLLRAASLSGASLGRARFLDVLGDDIAVGGHRGWVLQGGQRRGGFAHGCGALDPWEERAGRTPGTSAPYGAPQPHRPQTAPHAGSRCRLCAGWARTWRWRAPPAPAAATPGRPAASPSYSPPTGKTPCAASCRQQPPAPPLWSLTFRWAACAPWRAGGWGARGRPGWGGVRGARAGGRGGDPRPHPPCARHAAPPFPHPPNAPCPRMPQVTRDAVPVIWHDDEIMYGDEASPTSCAVAGAWVGGGGGAARVGASRRGLPPSPLLPAKHPPPRRRCRPHPP